MIYFIFSGKGGHVGVTINNERNKFFKKRPVLITTVAIIIFLLISVALSIVYLWPQYQNQGDGDDYRTNIPINSTIGIS